MKQPDRRSVSGSERRTLVARFCLALGALLILVSLAHPAPAAAALAVRINASASFGGNYRGDAWVPIVVTLANDGVGVTGEVVTMTSQGSKNGARYFQRVELPARSQKQLTLLVRPESGTSTVQVQFVAGRELVTAGPVRIRELRHLQNLVGIIADDAAAAAEYSRGIATGSSTGSTETVIVPPNEIPENSFGLDSFSGLVVADATTGRWSAEQRAALAAWVARGGQLVVTGGANWRKITEGLGELPPLRPVDTRTVSSLSGLGAGGGAVSSTVVAFGDLLANADVGATQDGTPLLVSRGWGRGTVTSLAFDPGAASFAASPLARALWTRLSLDADPPAALAAPFAGRSYNGSSGVVTGSNGPDRVFRVLNDLPRLALPPTWVLGLVLLFYILIIGPVNYLVLRFLDHRELAWITIPLLTVLFFGIVYAYGSVTRGRSAVLSTLSIVRISPGNRSAETQAFYGLFTPSRGERDIPFVPGALVDGYSTDGFGDLSGVGTAARIEQGATPALRGAAFEQWTQRTFAAQGLVDPAPLALRVELRREGSRLVGQIVNTTTETVEDVTLVYNNSYQRLNQLAPGASVAVNWTLSSTTPISSYAGLGSALYGPSYSYYGSSGTLGVTGRRALTLDALSGSVVDYRGRSPSTIVTPTPYRTPTPTAGAGGTPVKPTATPTPPAMIGSTVQPDTPVQVLFWRPSAPLVPRVGTSEQNVTTLVIQEVLPGAATVRLPAPAASSGARP